MNIDCIWLEENFFKQQLNEQQKKLVCNKFSAAYYHKGESIITQGEASRTVYIIYSGSVSIDCKNNDQHVHIGITGPRGLVGEMSFISEATASATVTAHEDCIIFKLSRQAFTEILQVDKGLVNLTFITLLRHTASVVRHMNIEKTTTQHSLDDSQF